MMPEIPKPPIAADVADVIGAWAERVDNRSLLMDKFVLHKSWPLVYSKIGGMPIKMDDASRWSFIRMAQNRDDYLRREQERLTSHKPNARSENVERDKIKADLVGKLLSCACRNLPGDLVQQKLEQTKQFAEALSQRGAVVVYAELGGRLIVNLSDSLIQNAGICLDRHTGLPYIPGSAVKGVTRHVALSHLRKGDLSLADFKAIFGSSESDFKESGELSQFADSMKGKKAEMTQKGGVDFLAAYPFQTKPLIAVDISNVHRPDYYASGKTADLAKENPRPNTFPTVEVGAHFAFSAVQNAIGVSPELFVRVRKFLVEAITIHGIGGKTGAGYGWFKDITEEVQAKARAEREQEERKRQKDEERRRSENEEALRRAEKARRASLSPCERILEEWERLSSSPKAIVNGDKIAKFDKQSKDLQMAIVEALRTDGVGANVWRLLNDEMNNKKRKIKHAPATVSAINRFVKAEKLEKLP